MSLFGQATVAIDGSKFKAVNNRDRNYTEHKAAKRIEQVEASIERYLATLGRADREASDVPKARVEHPMRPGLDHFLVQPSWRFIFEG